MRTFIVSFKGNEVRAGCPPFWVEVNTPDKLDLVRYWAENSNYNIIVSNEFGNHSFNGREVLFIKEEIKNVAI